LEKELKEEIDRYVVEKIYDGCMLDRMIMVCSERFNNNPLCKGEECGNIHGENLTCCYGFDFCDVVGKHIVCVPVAGINIETVYSDKEDILFYMKKNAEVVEKASKLLDKTITEMKEVE